MNSRPGGDGTHTLPSFSCLLLTQKTSIPGEPVSTLSAHPGQTFFLGQGALAFSLRLPCVLPQAVKRAFPVSCSNLSCFILIRRLLLGLQGIWRAAGSAPLRNSSTRDKGGVLEAGESPSAGTLSSRELCPSCNAPPHFPMASRHTAGQGPGAG